jgi:hypothetical protein
VRATSLILVSLILLATCQTACAHDDAVVLALEVSGELVAPPDLVARISSGLATIRTEFPVVGDFHVAPDWVPGQILCSLTPEGVELYHNGQFQEFDELNDLYGPVQVDELDEDFLSLMFQVPYHPILLAWIYHELSHMRAVGPNVTWQLGGTDITAEDIGPYTSTYTFETEWDCFDWCEHEHTWVFQVVGNMCILQDEHGDALVASEAQSWGSLKQLYR